MNEIHSSFKKRTYEVLESSDPDDLLSKLDDWGVTLLVILDVGAFILGTSSTTPFNFSIFLVDIEVVSVTCFTVLYILQLWSCNADERYNHPIWGRIQYAFSPLAIIDLLAILPFYILIFVPHVELAEATELLRLLRLLKLIRYSKGLQTILRVIETKKSELIMTLVTVFILLIFASSVMFFAERGTQPDVFTSIPAAMWWGVVTLTTVGYGDVYPVTVIGKLFGAILAFIGIGLFALPAGIIASGFSTEVQKRKEQESNHTKLPSNIVVETDTPNAGRSGGRENEDTTHECNLASKPVKIPSRQWTPEQKQQIQAYVEQRAELMRICIEAARRKFGDRFEEESIIRDLAISLYQEAVRQFDL